MPDHAPIPVTLTFLAPETDSGAPNLATLLCPTCGDHYSHIRDVVTRFGSDPAEAEVYPGTDRRGSVPGERRSALAILIEGECGHSWELRIQQHKGVNTLTALS